MEKISDAKLIRIAEVMHTLAADCETDAKKLDSRPFDGRNVGEIFGSMLAMVQAVAHSVEIVTQAMLERGITITSEGNVV